MRDLFFSSSLRANRPRWPAAVGAGALWCAAALIFSPGGLSPWSPWPALAAEPDAPLPPPEPLRFVFPKGGARLPLATGPYAFSPQEMANSRALERLFELQTRLASLPVRPVWVASSSGGVAKDQIRVLSAAVIGKAAGQGVDLPALPKAAPLTARTVDSDFDVIEYRLEPAPSAARVECAVMREVAFADMPSAVDGGSLRLVLVGTTATATPGTVWRDVPGVGRAGEPGRWRTWAVSDAATPRAGKSKEMSDYVRPWDGKLKDSPTMGCDVRLVAAAP